MKARKILAAPFIGIGLLFMAIGSLLAGEHIDLLQDGRPTH